MTYGPVPDTASSQEIRDRHANIKKALKSIKPRVIIIIKESKNGS